MITITITINEKELKQMTIPNIITPNQNNNYTINKEFNIKRKYLKKGEPWYHRKATHPICKIPPKTISTTLKSDKVLKQEPLLEIH